MTLQWKNFAFWIAAVLIIVLATIFYQPAAAKTGSLLVWTRDKVYVMDIDSLDLRQVGPAQSGQAISPSPGCYGQTKNPCWVLIDRALYQVNTTQAGKHELRGHLPLAEGFWWWRGSVSWSPDGVHLTYSTRNKENNQAQLHIYNAATYETEIIDTNIDPKITVAWTAACAEGLSAFNCQLGYKKEENEALAALSGYTPSTGKVEKWAIPNDPPIFELRWDSERTLLYSQPKRHFFNSQDHSPAYHLPPGGQLANLSPDAQYTVYYQPFTLAGCQPKNDKDTCLHIGVWLAPSNQENPARSLIYSADLSQKEDLAGLSFIPTWTSNSESFVIFQHGKLIHYDLKKQEGTIWYKPVYGDKLRSVPVFSPNEEAVAFVDNQGQGFSEYRLVVVNPRLQPVEHIIETESGFKVLAWLPN